MSHNIDTSNGQNNIAFLGSQNDIWHRLGQGMQPGMSIEDWAKAAGLDWSAVKVPAIADLSGSEFQHLPQRHRIISDARHIVRSDTGHPLGYVSNNRYHPVQPAEILDWFQRYISVDDHFQLDVAGSLRNGEIIWATATHNGGLEVAGDRHVARLLMTTTFDCSAATRNKGTMVRVVCNNTLDAALADRSCSVTTRHSSKFDADKVSKELATIAKGFQQFKAMGDAMARVDLSKAQIAKFFKSVLDIPFDAKEDDISSRKMNQFKGLGDAYRATAAEGTQPGTAWTALNAVTRYVDHDRSTRRGDNELESRVMSMQFGSGANMKEKAVQVLCEMSDIDLLKAVAAQTKASTDNAFITKALQTTRAMAV